MGEQGVCGGWGRLRDAMEGSFLAEMGRDQTDPTVTITRPPLPYAAGNSSIPAPHPFQTGE